MNDTVASTDEQIRSFAAAVRGHLDDLPSDELDEIIGGLTADLADQAADNDGVLDLGDPAAYADELRAAAGLPPRDVAPARPRLGERLEETRRRVAAGIRRSPVGAWALDMLLTLRPLWWALRGYGLYVVLVFVAVFGQPRDRLMVPDSLLEWAAIIVLVIASVQWGRGHRLPRNWLRHLQTVLNLVTIVALVFALPAALSPRVEYYSDGYDPQYGLRLDGVQINNIFAYDENGDPIERVQLFTGKGTPLDLYGGTGGQTLVNERGEIAESSNGRPQEFGMQDDGLRATIPTEDYRGRPVWNVYPLDETDIDTLTGMPDTSGVERPEPPFQKAPSVTATPAPSIGAPPAGPQPTETPAP